MTAARSRAQPPVGSAQWLLEEQRLADSFVAQEVEEFAFSARNEMEWLNEHMAEVLNRPQFDVAEAFKTPGKLRGKTPRTARKRGLLDDRQPLTDVFTASSQKPVASPPSKQAFPRQVAQFQVAEDKDDSHVDQNAPPPRYSAGTGKENTDSGYHEMTDEETEIEASSIGQQAIRRSPVKPHFALSVPQAKPNRSPSPQLLSQNVKNSDESQDTFVSAVEESHPRQIDTEKALDDEDATQPDDDLDQTLAPQRAILPESLSERPSNQYAVSDSTAAALQDALEKVERDIPTEQPGEADESASSSDGSSPGRPVVRKKSSLNFASLPAREPLTTKKSVGARTSHADHFQLSTSRDEQLGRQTFGKPADDALRRSEDVLKADEINADESKTELAGNGIVSKQPLDPTTQQGKTSTQLLQERFAMLGKSNVARASKSIPSISAFSQPNVSHGATNNEKEINKGEVGRDDDEGSWVGTTSGKPQERTMQKAPSEHQFIGQMMVPERHDDEVINEKNESAPTVTNIVYPTLDTKEAHVSTGKPLERVTLPDDIEYPDSEVPRSSSDEIKADGPISASKAKLFSVLKSAKGIFASSASVSAQAKMEALSSANGSTANPEHSRNIVSDEGNAEDELTRDEPQTAWETEVKPSSQKNETVEQDEYPRRRSSVRIKNAEEKKAHHSVQDVAKASAVRDNAEAPVQPPPAALASGQTMMDQEDEQLKDDTAAPAPGKEEDRDQLDMPPPPPPKPHINGTQMQKGEPRRPNRPQKETVPAKSRPAPVSIRLASQKIGQMGTANAGGASNQELGPPLPPKQPGLSKKTSNSSLHTSSSTQSFKSTVTSASARPKALEAAARKKEQDEREAERKAQQKREMERRRAAKAEEERLAAQEQRAAEQRASEAKQQAQKQAFEKRKAEAAQRAEQQRNQAAAAAVAAAVAPKGCQPAQDSSYDDRRMASQNPSRGETGTIRPVSRMDNTQEASRPAGHLNPAKPVKRQFNPDDHSHKPLPGRPVQHDQQPSKRRRTSEDSFAEVISRPTMAPPVRPSMLKKQENMNKYTSGFMNQSTLAHGTSSMLKNAVNNQHQNQHPKTPHMNDLAKYSNARIPFAEAPNPPQNGPYSAQQQQQPYQSRIQPPTKTPNSVNHKSSPHYPNGENIDLPEIATDSEDSDDDDFEPPDWANSPALRELLKDQQLVDPVQVFGPIAPLMMDEVFKGNKERQKKFRDRTSSANWNGPDRLTEEERRKDREARERLEKEGAWTYGNST